MPTKLVVGWLDHLVLVLPGQELLGESQPALTPTLRQGNYGNNRCTTIYITIYSCDHKFRIIEVLLSLLSLLFVRSSYGSGGDAKRSYLQYVQLVISYPSVFSFGETTTMVGAMLKPN